MAKFYFLIDNEERNLPEPREFCEDLQRSSVDFYSLSLNLKQCTKRRLILQARNKNEVSDDTQ